MQLENIDKTLYRKRLNIVIISFVSSLLILSLVLGSLLIATFGDVGLNADGQSDNFRYNLLGVLLAVLACAAVLHQLKHKAMFKEIYYVWKLKQLHNRIYRKHKKIKLAAKSDDVNAIIILNFYYHTRKQVYKLDDNTLTLSALEKDIAVLNEQIKNKNLSVTLEQFDQSLLGSY